MKLRSRRRRKYYISQHDEIIPSLEDNDRSTPAVMGGLDPAIQGPKPGVWMPGSRPGMTARVTNKES
jgi:hypothetical protein